MFDSVFSRFADPLPFPDDKPLMAVGEINRVLDAIESASSQQQLKVLEAQAEDLLRRADPFLASGDVAGIQALTWSAATALQAPIFSCWQFGWQAGSGHMLEEMRSAVPPDLRPGKFSRFATQQQLDAIGALFQLERDRQINSQAEQAILRRASHLAGNFSNSQLGSLKTALIAAVSPDLTGAVLSRRELLDQIQSVLNVGRVRADMIARTELTEAYNTSRVTTALRSDLVTHLRFLAISDDRTTPICQSRNGMLIPVGDQGAIAANKPALHVRCRSTLSPVLAGINPDHEEWANDPARDYQNRDLEPLPDGWN